MEHSTEYKQKVTLLMKVKYLLWKAQFKVFQKMFGGHINIGPVTIFGLNAMHWGVTIRLKKGYACFRLPLPCFGRFPALYFYLSPNGTPWAATYIIGGGNRLRRDRALAQIRRIRLGLWYNSNDEDCRKILRTINAML